ncbi:MAG TPA: hypothetical protein VJH22_05025 [Candidatus Nanoarchaeia archaeon]|nr:hypothetical protein [Candidatus Nanoarchaeia archaeon]
MAELRLLPLDYLENVAPIFEDTTRNKYVNHRTKVVTFYSKTFPLINKRITSALREDDQSHYLTGAERKFLGSAKRIFSKTKNPKVDEYSKLIGLSVEATISRLQKIRKGILEIEPTRYQKRILFTISVQLAQCATLLERFRSIEKERKIEISQIEQLIRTCAQVFDDLIRLYASIIHKDESALSAVSDQILDNERPLFHTHQRLFA